MSETVIYGKIWQNKAFFSNKNSHIENKSPQIESFLFVKKRLLSVDSEKMVTLLQILAICSTKTGFFGEKLRR